MGSTDAQDRHQPALNFVEEGEVDEIERDRACDERRLCGGRGNPPREQCRENDREHRAEKGRIDLLQVVVKAAAGIDGGRRKHGGDGEQYAAASDRP
jgi:hypothetical protein